MLNISRHDSAFDSNHLKAKTLAVSLALLTMTGCKTTEITAVSFAPGGGTYAEGLSVSITLPPKATNVYLTTDSLDPVPHAQCAYAGENLTLNRSALVKVGYDVAGVHYQVENLYVIENNVEDSGYTNRKLISTWERFFVEHVLRRINVPNETTSTLQLDDGEGGIVSVLTNIFDRTVFGAPEKADQTYSFDFFKMADEDTGETVVLKSGQIYGYRDDDEGFYTTLRTGAGDTGSRLEFSGTYSGWADGDFKMNAQGQTTSGYYKVFCLDNGCAANPVIYALGTKNQLIEVDSFPDADTRTCRTAVTPE